MTDLSLLFDLLSFIAAAACLAITAMLLRIAFRSRVAVLDAEAFNSFAISGHLMLLAMALISAALLLQPYSMAAYDLVELLAILLLLFSILLFSRYLRTGGSSMLAEVDWGEIAKDIEEREAERTIKEDRAFVRLLEKLKGKSFLLVEIEEGAAVFPILEYLYTRLAYGVSSDYAACAVLGPTTPYDIGGSIQPGSRCNVWVNSATPPEGQATYFTSIAPEDRSEVVHYFNAIGLSVGRKLAFVGDFLDEMADKLSDRELHGIISDIRTGLKMKGNLLVLVVATGLYPKGRLAILERYADGIVRVKDGRSPSMEFLDERTNETESLGRIPLKKKA